MATSHAGCAETAPRLMRPGQASTTRRMSTSSTRYGVVDGDRRSTVTSGEVRIREQALPGIGHRFELDMADGRSLVVVARRDGSRDVAVRSGDDDATEGRVRLARQQAVARPG